VDNKNQINQILVFLLTILFPLNQQYHFRPFPSVDGFIIDYLIIKVSIPEIFIFSLLILNVNQIFKFIRNWSKTSFFWLFLSILVISIFRSNYIFLALYENMVLISLILFGYFLSQNLDLINRSVLSKSIIVWIILLCLLGFFQFFFQRSVLNNYALFGEFPYSEDNYHIKEKGLFFDNMIPPYSIFSHSNIFGGYLIFLLFLLSLLKKDFWALHFLVFLNLLIIGSFACLAAYILYFIARKMDFEQLKFTLKCLVILSIASYFIFSYRYEEYQNDFSIYRRLYMFDLSLNFFNSNPISFIFGSGYYNYFFQVKDYLYKYELIRFFQPPHFLLFLIIWQYGFLMLLWILTLVIRYKSNLNQNFLRLLILIVVIGTFDHYLISNHQFKIILMLLVPYSLKIKNSI
jgi:hypothetical protein